MKKQSLITKICCIGIASAMSIAAGVMLPEGVSYAAVNSGASVQNIVITDNDGKLSITEDGRLNCYGKTYTISGYYAEVNVELQRYDGGWDTKAVWNDRKKNEAIVTKYKTTDRGYTYRLKLTHSAYDADWNLIESFTSYSNEVWY